MNSTDETPGTAGVWPTGDPGTLVIGSPGDAVAAVPYLLGFHPADSIVVVAYASRLGTGVFRVDVPEAGDEADADADKMAQLLARNGFTRVLLVGYGPGQRITPVIEVFADALRRVARIDELLRVHEGRWWSYLCSDPQCCPPEGTPFDAGSAAIAAQAVLAGQTLLGSRDELAATVAPLTGPVREAMGAATERVERRLQDLHLRAYRDLRRGAESARDPGRGDAADPRVARGVPLVQTLLAQESIEEFLADADQVAWLGLLLTHLRVRDEAWVRIDPDDPEPHITLWREVLRRVEEPYAAAPACLLAYAAFISGDGALANVALDRADAADPDYTMAALLRDVIRYGLPPAAARLQMTPEDLAEAWDQAQDGR
jgi:hypothetical protein